MATVMHLEIGVPITDTMTDVSDRLVIGELPAGHYATLTYTGASNGVAGNATLLGWVGSHGIELDRSDDERGDAYGCRIEWMLDGPDDDPDPSSWRTEIAIKTRDHSAFPPHTPT